jgi:hypothetical protein
MMTLPWHDREQLMRERAEVLSGALPTDLLAELASLFDDRRNTAELYSDPDLVSALAEPIAEPLGIAVR